MHFAEAVLQDFAEADQQRKGDTAELEIIDQFLEIDAAGGLFIRMDPEVSIFADGKIAFSPAGDVVELASLSDTPAIGGFAQGSGVGGFYGSHSVSSVVCLGAQGK